MNRSSIILSTIMLISFFCSCKTKTTGQSALRFGDVPIELDPPKFLYHFGMFDYLEPYKDYVGPPSAEVWTKIPSTGSDYTVERRGLYGSQHPAYNERYAAEYLGKAGRQGPWLVVIELEDRCSGPNRTNKEVVVDERWPGSGFWIVRDRTCIKDILASPEDVLEVFATVPELWNKAPFVSKKDRKDDDGKNATKVLFTVFVKALSLVEETRPKLFEDIESIASKSDLPEAKAIVSRTASAANFCFSRRQWFDVRQKLGDIVDKYVIDFSKFRTGTLDTLCEGADAEDLIIRNPDPAVAALDDQEYANAKTCRQLNSDTDQCLQNTNCMPVKKSLNNDAVFECVSRYASCRLLEADQRACSKSLRKCKWVNLEFDDYGEPSKTACADPVTGINAQACFKNSSSETQCKSIPGCEYIVRKYDDLGAPSEYSCVLSTGSCAQYRENGTICNKHSQCIFAITEVDSYGEISKRECMERAGSCQQFKNDLKACLSSSSGCKFENDTCKSVR
ncbi:MAG: hypothetical protein NT027_10000 [Proteobacteria bacterium]|nr:hypothetical protein [Pseudomonadota bacterium]